MTIPRADVVQMRRQAKKAAELTTAASDSIGQCEKAIEKANLNLGKVMDILDRFEE